MQGKMTLQEMKESDRPEGKGRPRFRGHAYTPKKTVDYEKTVRTLYLKAGGNLIYGEVDISISAYFRIPKSVTKAERSKMELDLSRPTIKPDVDNIGKVIMDALGNAVAYNDDKQVVDLTVRKFYSERDFVYVTVKETEKP